jgi:transcriptional regulator with XRE-family HTH domain
MEAFKQPQLGQTIVALRQEKKLTQEELVERCNLNVRTLQRIEAGDVTPRDYTVRAILTALEYDFNEIEENFVKKAIYKRVQWAWIAGIAYFLTILAETAVDYLRFEEMPMYFTLIYTSVKALVMVSCVMFMLGFVEAGSFYKNSLLKISAYLMMGSLCVIEFYDIISIFSGMTAEEFMFTKGMEAVIFGGVDILFGIALIQLRHVMGTSALVAGILEILVGLFFVTFLLAFIGLFFMVPAIILEIVVLYKFYDKLTSN